MYLVDLSITVIMKYDKKEKGRRKERKKGEGREVRKGRREREWKERRNVKRSNT